MISPFRRLAISIGGGGGAAKPDGAPSNLILTVLSDTSIKLDWTIGSTNQDGHVIEYSADGLIWVGIDTVLGITATYTELGLDPNTHYYYRVCAYVGTQLSTYSNIADDWTAMLIPLAATGTGAGVATLRMLVDTTNVTATIDSNGHFYTNSLGTLGESTSWTITAGALRTIYLKVTSGNSNLLVFAKNNLKRWGDNTAIGWEASTNAPTTSFNIDSMPATVQYLSITGNNTISGSISTKTALIHFNLPIATPTVAGSLSLLTNLEHFDYRGAGTITGTITNLIKLTRLYVSVANTITGSVTGITNLSVIHLATGNTISGDVTTLTSLTTLWVLGSNTLTGSLNNLTSLTYIYVTGLNTLSADFGTQALLTGLTNLILAPCRITTYTSGATWPNVGVTLNPATSYGLDSTEIDNILIDMAASGVMVSRMIQLKGSNAARTAASDAAVATLVAAGNTVQTN